MDDFTGFWQFSLAAVTLAVLGVAIVRAALLLISTDSEDRRLFVRIALACGSAAVTLWVGSLLYAEIDDRLGYEGRYATRVGRTITIHPTGTTFTVPLDWIAWNNQFHNNFHLSHRELRRVRRGSGEWDTEYADVVNAVLPFEHCAAHAGGEGWGAQAASFRDLQMRVYVTDLSTDAIRQRFVQEGWNAAQRIAKEEGGLTGSEAHLTQSTSGEWQHFEVDYPLWYGDYGGEATIEFYVREVAGTRLAFVFMGWGEDERNAILGSVTIPK